MNLINMFLLLLLVVTLNFSLHFSLRRTLTRGRARRALAAASSGSFGKVTDRRGKPAFGFIKFIESLHKWVNTISSQFPHYANMQNIKSRPIRDSLRFEFSGLRRNCRDPQIITRLIANICDRYNKFSPQITFHPRNHRAPLKYY